MAMPDTLGFDLREDAGCWTVCRAAANRPVEATIVIPTYRAAATLNRALLSALSQTMTDIEVIVVDDASTDASWDVALEAMRHEPRLHGIRNKHNCGKPVGMNRAIARARGRWLAVLDADDWYRPERLEALIALGERAHVDLVADNQLFYDAGASRVVRPAWPEAESAWPLSFDDFLAGSDAYESFNLGMLKPVIRTDFLRRTGLGYEERARHGQDFFHLLDFFLRGGKAVVSDRALYYYTLPFGAVSRRWSHAERRRYDFQTACDINRQYLVVARAALTSAQAVQLKRRNDKLASLEMFFQARERFGRGDAAGAAAKILRHPAILGYAWRRLRRRWAPQSGSQPIERIAARARRYAPDPMSEAAARAR
jgi:succinoglycan biosynthesis protein ExoO